MMPKLLLENTSNIANGVTMETCFAIVAINNHMTVIHVHVHKNTIKDILLDGGSRINIITK